MTDVRIDGNDLVVVIRGLSKFWALSGDIHIPLAAITAARAYGGVPDRWSAGVRVGTGVLGLFLAGRCWHPTLGTSFWFLKDARRAIYLEVAAGPYRRLVIDVPDVATTVARIAAARTP